MARDIEEFLRRAAERKKQLQQENQSPPTAERVRQAVRESESEVYSENVTIVKPSQKKKKPPQQQPSTSKRKSISNKRESVAQHVRQHINTRDIAEHATHLGEGIQRADDRIAARLRRKFDHDVSSIDDLPSVQDDAAATVTDTEVSAVARELLEMLGSPQSVRQAILISEILNRPHFD